MSLRRRFLLSLLALLALMSVPAVYGVSRVNALRDMVHELSGQTARSALAIGRLQEALWQVDRYQRAYVATADHELVPRMQEAMTDVVAEVRALRHDGHADDLGGVGLHVNDLAKAMVRLETLVQARMLDTATMYLVTVAAPLVERARAAVPPMAAAIDANTTARAASAQRNAVAAATTATTALLIAFVLATALALAVAGVLTRPLARLRIAMATVAEGTFEAPDDLPYDRPDELGHLARSFRTMTARLAELDRLKAEFVGTASHDLKTPISVITGYAALMQEELNGSLEFRHKELLRSLAEQTQSLQRRVDQLLEISRMEAGRLRLGLEEINVRHFFQEMHQTFEPAAHSRDIRLEIQVDVGAPPFLIADPDLLRSDVLGNLLGNAMKFTPAGGSIHVLLRPDGDRVHIDVADTGRGIPPDQIDHIFEKYYQGRGAKGGSGLGLAIARAAVEAHGGTIKVRSNIGRGTRFRVTLPVRAHVAAPQPANVS